MNKFIQTSKLLLLSSLIFTPAVLAEYQDLNSIDAKLQQAKKMSRERKKNGQVQSAAPLFLHKEKPTVITKWTGSVNNTNQISANTALLNDSLPDKTNWLRTVFNLTFDCSVGEKEYGHKAVQMQAAMRHKEYWGLNASKTDSELTRVGNALTAGHSHGLAQPPLWIYSLWVDFSLDSLGGQIESPGLNHIKVGYFPFSLGRGIALGEAYGVSQDFLGTYVKSNDYFMPGCLLYGSWLGNKFDYQFYYARPEAKSASVKQTLNLTKEHWVDNKGLPFAGTFRDDHIVAASCKLKAEGKDKKNRYFHLNPYGFYFWGHDKKVNVEPDSDIDLSTAGVALETKNYWFECGCDVAVNFGRQVVRSVDKNKLILESEATTALHTEKLDNVVTVSDGLPAVATANLLTELASNPHRDGNVFTVDGIDYQSSTGRITSSYTNTHRGRMAVADFAITGLETGTKIAGIVGYASGDANPHSRKVNKTYDGFLGINETYSSRRVPSMIILGGARLKRPLALQGLAVGSDARLKDFAAGAFTDLFFTGGGVALDLKLISNYTGALSANVLYFWKDFAGNKVEMIDDPDNAGQTKPVISAEKASNKLGIEVNGGLKLKLLDSLDFSVSGGAFFPGQHYRDVTGALLSDALTKKLAQMDQDKATLAKKQYKMGNDTCWFVATDLKFTF